MTKGGDVNVVTKGKILLLYGLIFFFLEQQKIFKYLCFSCCSIDLIGCSITSCRKYF